MGWVGLFSACVPPVPGVRSGSKEVWEQDPKSECPSLASMVAEVRPKRRYARMKVLIGVDPHKASVAVAAVDEATGELLERAGFSQDRSGLRCLERWAKRFPKRRWAMETAGRARSAPGGEVGGSRRVRGRRAAEAFGAGACAL